MKIAKAHGLGAAEVDALLADLIANAMIRVPSAQSPIAPDPADTHIWALAATHPGVVIVTGDQLLLKSPPAGARVITPRVLVDRLRGT